MNIKETHENLFNILQSILIHRGKFTYLPVQVYQGLFLTVWHKTLFSSMKLTIVQCNFASIISWFSLLFQVLLWNAMRSVAYIETGKKLARWWLESLMSSIMEIWVFQLSSKDCRKPKDQKRSRNHIRRKQWKKLGERERALTDDLFMYIYNHSNR